MKLLVGNTGGRAARNDDFFTLQTELYAAIYGPYLNRGAFIVTGCEVSGPAGAYMVTAGIVCLDGTFARFGGASGVALPMQLERDTSAPSFVEERPYQTGGVQVCIREYTAHLVPATGSNGREFVTLTAAGAKRWQHILQAATRTIGETQELVAPGSFVPANYDATGVGLVGTEAWGWALCNGQGSRANLMGRVTVGLDPSRADYDAIGDAGGRETVTLLLSQIPAHTHQLQMNVDTDGGPTQTVTRAGNQGASGNTPDSGTAGGGQAHENRMPFYTVLKRQWVGFGS
jgi:hypothetical protein